MKRLSFRFLSAILCVGVAACGGVTFTAAGDGGGGSSGGGSGGSSSGGGSGSSSGGGSGSSSGGGSGSSSGGGDAGGHVFSCGPTLQCDGRLQYCQITEGGAVQIDGGTNVSYACQPIPLKCALDHTCKCIAASTAGQCSESGGDVTVTLFAP